MTDAQLLPAGALLSATLILGIGQMLRHRHSEGKRRIDAEHAKQNLEFGGFSHVARDAEKQSEAEPAEPGKQYGEKSEKALEAIPSFEGQAEDGAGERDESGKVDRHATASPDTAAESSSTEQAQAAAA